MTSICLLRHGQTDWNKAGRIQGKTDIPLNDTGILQAEKCAEFLAQSTWDIIISSPLSRAKQTADVLRKKIQLPLLEMAVFTERSYGDAEGMTIKESEATFSNRNYPNQETQVSLTNRIMRGIQMIHDTYPNGKVLLISHGGVINGLLAVLSNGEIGSGKTRLNHASISNIYYHQNTWQIKDYNQIAHLSLDTNE